jgi:hypothetical protein
MSQFDSGTASSAEALECELASAAVVSAAVVRAIVMGRTLHLVTRRYSLLLRAALSLAPPHRAADEASRARS